MSNAPPVTPDLETLATLFYPTVDDLGQFEEVSVKTMSWPHQALLAHYNHMTVTVEAFYQRPVGVEVLDKSVTDEHYARKILLTRKSDGAVVQFGIMRVSFKYLDPEVRAEIESERIPLGRLLIERGVLRAVELVSLWKVTPGEELRERLGMSPGETTHGRTALIHVNDEPAIELLEIVLPEGAAG